MVIRRANEQSPQAVLTGEEISHIEQFDQEFVIHLTNGGRVGVVGSAYDEDNRWDAYLDVNVYDVGIETPRIKTFSTYLAQKREGEWKV